MFAIVARTASEGGAFSLRSRAARVTHTLLFAAALAISPGVCGACASGCSTRGFAAAGIPGTGVAFAVAATHGGTSCCGTSAGGPPEGTVSPDASPAAVADAADGISLPCCRGAAGCDCLLEPRESEAAVPPATSSADAGEPMPAAIAVLADLAETASRAVQLTPGQRRPERPARVLYGVWRN
jgi:hypothetical protein